MNYANSIPLLLAIGSLCPVASASTLALYGSDLPISETASGLTEEGLKNKALEIDGLVAGNLSMRGGVSSTTRSRFGGDANEWVNIGGSLERPDYGWFFTNNYNWSGGSSRTSTSATTPGYEFKLTAGSGSVINLSSISFDWNIAINNSSLTLAGYANIYVAGDDGVFHALLDNDATLTAAGKGTGATAYGYGTTVTADAIPDVLMGQSELTVRISLASSLANSGSYSFFTRNIQVNGDVLSIPEPSPVLLGLCGAMTVMGFRRRNGRSSG